MHAVFFFYPAVSGIHVDLQGTLHNKKLAGWCRRDCQWKGQLSPRIFRLLEPALLCSVLFTLGFGRNILADVAITLPSSPPLPRPFSHLPTLEASEGSKNLALKKEDSDWSAVYDPTKQAMPSAAPAARGTDAAARNPKWKKKMEREEEKWEMRILRVDW